MEAVFTLFHSHQQKDRFYPMTSSRLPSQIIFPSDTSAMVQIMARCDHAVTVYFLQIDRIAQTGLETQFYAVPRDRRRYLKINILIWAICCNLDRYIGSRTTPTFTSCAPSPKRVCTVACHTVHWISATCCRRK